VFLAIFVLDRPFSDHFAGGLRDCKLVAQKAAEGGWVDPSELPDIMTDDQLKLFIKIKDPTLKQLENFGPNLYPRWFVNMEFLDPKQQMLLSADHAPEWLTMCFPNVIPPHMQQMLLRS
jgi:hypothetical protein